MNNDQGTISLNGNFDNGQGHSAYLPKLRFLATSAQLGHNVFHHSGVLAWVNGSILAVHMRMRFNGDRPVCIILHDIFEHGLRRQWHHALESESVSTQLKSSHAEVKRTSSNPNSHTRGVW
jgi:hypothetical protein